MTASRPGRAPFHLWQQASLKLVWVYDTAIPDALRRSVDREEHHLTAWLIRKGRLKLQSGGRSLSAEAGEWVVPTTKRRSLTYSRGSAILSVRSDIHWPTGQLVFPVAESLVFPATRHPELESSGRALAAWEHLHLHSSYNLGNTPMHWGAFVRLQALHHAWLDVFTAVLASHGIHPQTLNVPDERLQRALEWIQSAALNRPLDRRELAHRAGMSLSQLDRRFASELRRSPGSIHEARRIDYACARLAEESGGQIKEIAADLGFHSLPAFTQWFVRKRKLAPRDFRSQYLRPPGPPPGDNPH